MHTNKTTPMRSLKHHFDMIKYALDKDIDIVNITKPKDGSFIHAGVDVHTDFARTYQCKGYPESITIAISYVNNLPLFCVSIETKEFDKAYRKYSIPLSFDHFKYQLRSLAISINRKTYDFDINDLIETIRPMFFFDENKISIQSLAEEFSIIAHDRMEMSKNIQQQRKDRETVFSSIKDNILNMPEKQELDELFLVANDLLKSIENKIGDFDMGDGFLNRHPLISLSSIFKDDSNNETFEDVMTSMEEYACTNDVLRNLHLFVDKHSLIDQRSRFIAKLMIGKSLGIVTTHINDYHIAGHKIT
jgi:hypothetical protein